MSELSELSVYQIRSLISQLMYNQYGDIYFFVPKNPEPETKEEVIFMKEHDEYENRYSFWQSIFPFKYGVFVE